MQNTSKNKKMQSEIRKKIRIVARTIKKQEN